jgi:hypothetical protein
MREFRFGAQAAEMHRGNPDIRLGPHLAAIDMLRIVDLDVVCRNKAG